MHAYRTHPSQEQQKSPQAKNNKHDMRTTKIYNLLELAETWLLQAAYGSFSKKKLYSNGWLRQKSEYWQHTDNNRNYVKNDADMIASTTIYWYIYPGSCAIGWGLPRNLPVAFASRFQYFSQNLNVYGSYRSE